MTLSFAVLEHVRQRPWLFYPMMRLSQALGRNQGVALLSKETALVIEGFWRCGNSFAIQAFLAAQPRKARLCNYTHAPATIKLAYQRRVPTLIVIREPGEAIPSMLLKMPQITAEQALRSYARYYNAIMPYHSGYVVALFEEVIRDFGGVTARINQRFNTTFAAFEHSAANANSVMRRIEEIDRTVDQDATRFSTPSSVKEAAKEQIKQQLQTPELARLLREADQVYTRFIGLRST